MSIEQVTDAAEELDQTSQKLYGKAAEKIEQTRERLDDIANQVRQKAEDSWDDIGQLVKENPMTSVGIALVVGVGLGSLLTALAKRD